LIAETSWRSAAVFIRCWKFNELQDSSLAADWEIQNFPLSSLVKRRLRSFHRKWMNRAVGFCKRNMFGNGCLSIAVVLFHVIFFWSKWHRKPDRLCFFSSTQ
jgi:hypothetical protein